MTETRKFQAEALHDGASFIQELAESGKLYYQSCRDNADITQEDAAQYLSIDVSTLSRYENGHSVPDQQTVAKMVLLYKVPKLARWHVMHTHPDLVPYLHLPEINELRSDGDSYLALDISSDALAEYKGELKRMFNAGRAGRPSTELKAVESGLKKVADEVLSIAAYISCRRGA